MSSAALTVKRFQKFGELRMIGDDVERSGWVTCQCAGGKYRSVLERRLLNGEITACVACTGKMKMEKLIND
jgi:hypothetical protein